MRRIYYEIRWYSQVLTNGTWGSPDCEWDWKTTTVFYLTKEKAEKVFRKVKPTNGDPIIRLYRVEQDEYGITNEELLDERS